jgi:hypothetical protein
MVNAGLELCPHQCHNCKTSTQFHFLDNMLFVTVVTLRATLPYSLVEGYKRFRGP